MSSAAASAGDCVRKLQRGARAIRDSGTSSCLSHTRSHLHFSLHLLGEREPQLGRFVLITFHEERRWEGVRGGGEAMQRGAGLLPTPRPMAGGNGGAGGGGVSLREDLVVEGLDLREERAAACRRRKRPGRAD